ncbi:hypothetical protein BDW68DRAFT_10400 [Aspergillus falconensis]
MGGSARKKHSSGAPHLAGARLGWITSAGKGAVQTALTQRPQAVGHSTLTTDILPASGGLSPCVFFNYAVHIPVSWQSGLQLTADCYKNRLWRPVPNAATLRISSCIDYVVRTYSVRRRPFLSTILRLRDPVAQGLNASNATMTNLNCAWHSGLLFLESTVAYTSTSYTSKRNSIRKLLC